MYAVGRIRKATSGRLSRWSLTVHCSWIQKVSPMAAAEPGLIPLAPLQEVTMISRSDGSRRPLGVPPGRVIAYVRGVPRVPRSSVPEIDYGDKAQADLSPVVALMDLSYKDYVDRCRIMYLQRRLDEAHGNAKAAARASGVSRSYLNRFLWRGVLKRPGDLP